MFKTTVDFAADMNLQDGLDHIQKHGGQITSFIAHGPGGGNPCLTLTFPTRAGVDAFLADHYSQDTKEWRDTLVEQIAA